MSYSTAPDTARIKKEIPNGEFQLTTHNSQYDLYNLDEYDKDFLSPVYTKPEEKIFRFQTARMMDLFKPLVKINIERKLIYFLTEEAQQQEKVHFESKGIKARYIVFKS